MSKKEIKFEPRVLGMRNIGSQTVLADGVINLGIAYRRFDDNYNPCRIFTFNETANGITIQREGIYKVSATFVGTGETAGDVTIQLVENGIPVDGVISTETITTATTEFRTFVIDYLVKVDRDCVLGYPTTDAKNISFINASDGIDATFTSVIVNVTKEV